MFVGLFIVGFAGELMRMNLTRLQTLNAAAQIMGFAILWPVACPVLVLWLFCFQTEDSPK